MKTPKLPQMNAETSQLPEELSIEIWQQFQRDLSKIGEHEVASEGTTIDVKQILTKISESLYYLLLRQEEKFWQLLYVVDLPEAYLEKIEATEKGIEACARIVLIREWQKVVLRQHFSAS